MDQLGNTERISEEPGSENGQPEGEPGVGDAPCTLAVYRADLAVEAGDAGAGASAGADGAASDGDASQPAAGPSTAAEASAVDSYPDGFTGTLALQNLESFDEGMVGEALGRVEHLISWGQTQRARLINRMEELFREDLRAASGRIEPGMAFTLAASECAAILNVPQVTAQRLMFEAGKLCGANTATLAGLEEGQLSYAHAQVVLDQCENVPAMALPEFEADLLTAAEGQTRSQFSAKARRLREKRYPETVAKRHLSVFEQRRVTLDREEDGMSCLSAHLRAEDAQQIYTTLSTAARGEQTAGDPRTADQLRADILAQLLMGGSRGLFAAEGTRGGVGHTGDSGRTGGSGGTGGSVRTGGSGDSGGSGRTGGSVRTGGSGCTGDDTGGAAWGDGDVGGSEGAPVSESGPDEGIVPRAEIMVLINAETLFGADEQPAELHGYGPISAEAARRLARNAAGWTGLAQDPHTGEILGVGRRRKVPAGLRRWLRARDGTCRFPGCRVSTANSDIDHTIDWARGGPTDHGNLEHLCRRHHRFKTLGYWKACQPSPGVIEWTSPTGRVYRTDSYLELGPHMAQNAAPHRNTHTGQEDSSPNESPLDPPPPF